MGKERSWHCRIARTKSSAG